MVKDLRQAKSEYTPTRKWKVYKEERDVLEERGEIDECDMEEFDPLDSSDKTIAIRWSPQAAKQKRDESSKLCFM